MSEAAELTAREREVLAVLGMYHTAAVHDIRRQLHPPTGAATVRRVLSRLERKGLVSRAYDGRRGLFRCLRPATPADEPMRSTPASAA